MKRFVSDLPGRIRRFKAARQLRRHDCRWPGCQRQVGLGTWGCRQHWYKLPPDLRARIHRTMRLEHLAERRPSEAWTGVMAEAQAWIARYLSGRSRVLRGQQELDL